MVGCSIRNCKSRSVKGGSIRFFTFPKVDSLARQWLRYCSPNTTAKNGRICSNHFGPDDYITSLKHSLMKEVPSKTRILKPEAVPNILINIEKRKSKHSLSKAPIPLSVSVKVESMGEAGSSLNRTSTDSLLDMASADIKCNLESPTYNDGVSNSDYFDLSLDKIKKELKGEKGADGAVEVKSDSESDNDDDPLSHISTKLSASTKRPKCDFNGDRIYASEIAGPSLRKEENSSDKYTVPVAEYRLLKRKMKEYSVLKKNLELIFTPGQIKCLMKPKKNRVTWATEDIVAAISLRKVSPRAYNHLRGKIGIPLPGFSTLCKWAAKCGLDVGSLDREEEPEENKPIQCDVCQKFFKSRPSFVKHCKIHSGVRVICEHCGKEFLDKRRLLMHCRSKHGYQKTDKCTYCDYLGISPESVKIHERIHTGEKPYKCKECPASFHRSSSYLQHTARHLPEKTVQCQQCPALFKSVTLMRIHANRHKPRDHKFKCLVCGGNFSSRSSVGRHLRRAHAVARCTQAHLQRVKLNEP